MLEVGANFDRYQIEAVLGAGGMGQVYRAFDTRLQRRVALKVLKAPEDLAPAERADAVARLLREARAAAALEHPNVVAVYDVGEVDGTPFMAMELVSGRDLRALLGDATRTWRERLRWLLEIARALAAAHQAGLVHRDIKPENVRVCDSGQVKVLDFGIARRAALAVSPVGDTATPDGLATITAAGALIGTPLYMAPEQIRREPVDGRTDQFAWGVTAYEALAGRVPWVAADAVALLAKILTDEPAPLRTLKPDIPEEVASVIARCLRKKPDERYASMDEVVATLEPFAAADAKSPAASPRAAAGVALAPTLATPAPMITTLPPAAAARPHGRILKALVVLLLAAAGAVAIVKLRARSSTPAATGPAPASAPASMPARGIAVVDLERPKTSSPEAAAAYAAGLQAIRDGAIDLAVDHLQQAVKADPALAAAHLQLSFAMGYYQGPSVEGKAALSKALLLRKNLSSRDADWAVAAALRGSPELKAQALVKVGSSYPLDAQLALVGGGGLAVAGFVSEAAAAEERAVALDPSFALAWGKLAVDYAYLGKPDAARHALERCLAISPRATVCLGDDPALADQAGDCDRFDKAVRARAEVGRLPAGDRSLAEGLAARGASPNAVLEALERDWLRLPDPERASRKERDRGALAALRGEFEEATRGLRSAQREVAATTDPWRWLHVTAALLQLLFEQDRRAEAARIAGDLESRLPALPLEEPIEDFGIAQDPRPRLTDALYRAGRITRTARDARRATWLRELEQRVTGFMKPYLWVQAYAEYAESPEEAHEALDALPRFGAIPSFRPLTATNFGIGRTYLLAGKVDEAIPYLTKATKACTPLSYPVPYVRSNLFLGMALAKKGDKPGACAAYAKVLKHWGKAKPRSVSAEQARKLSRELGCPAG